MKKFRKSIITSFVAGMIIGVLPANAEKFNATPQLRAQIEASVRGEQVVRIQGSAGISAVCEKRLRCLRQLSRQIESSPHTSIGALISNYLGACGILGKYTADERVLSGSRTIEEDLKYNIGMLMRCYKGIEIEFGVKGSSKSTSTSTPTSASASTSTPSGGGTREGRKGGYRRMVRSEKR